MPTSGHAAISVPGTSVYTVTANGSTSVNVLALDLGSSNATAVFDFSSSGAGLNLGTATSNWTAGKVEFRNSNGLFGNGAANTMLNVGSGVELLYSTSTNLRYLQSLSVANAGTIHVTSGILSISYGSLTNQAGGLLYADGAEIDLSSTQTLNNVGTIKVNGANGKLYVGSSLTTANLGNVTLLNGGHAYLTGTLNNASATLTAPSGGTYELLGGTIVGGAIAAGAVTFTSSDGHLNAATLNDDLTLLPSAYVRLSNGAGFTGATATLGNSSGLYWQQTGTLAGKAMTMGTGSYVYLQGGNASLTLGNTTTVSGDIQIYSDGSSGSTLVSAGTVTHTSTSTGTFNAPLFTNSGTITNTAPNGALVVGSTNASYATANTGSITVNASGATVYLDGNIDNTGGTLNATNGALIFRASNTTAHLNGGTLNIASGAHAYLNGTLTNGNATLNAPASGKYELYGGTITGGTIAAGALTFTGYVGNLDAATLDEDLTLPASTAVRLINGATFTGGNVSLGNSAGVYWQQSGTLAGKAMTLGTGSYVYLQGGNATLTIANSSTAQGYIDIYSDGSTGSSITNQGTLTHTSTSTGSINAPSLTNTGTITNTAVNGALVVGSTNATYATANTGNITVNATGATLYLDGNIDNTGGTLNATDGALIFRGTNTTAHLNGGTLNIASGAHAYLNGTLTNGNATLNAPASGSYELYGGTISGGTIAAGALTFTGYGGYLDNATLTGDLTLPNTTNVRLMNGGAFTGGNAMLGNSSTLYWQQSGTVAGKTLTLGNGAEIYVAGGNDTLTLDSTTSVTGDIQLHTDGSAGTAITIQGTVAHTISSTGTISAPQLTNSGDITNSAPNTALVIGGTSSGYATTNTGNITVNATGASVYLDGNINNTGGKITATNGQLIFRGSNTTAHLSGGTINVASGSHAYLNGTLDNTAATLLGPTSGIYELYGGTITGGTVAPGALTYTNYGGYLDGATLNEDLNVPANAYVRLINNATISGGNVALGTSAGLYWEQAGTLSGKTLTFANGSYLYVSGGNHTLTLGPTSTTTGDVQIYTDGSSGTAITNQGTITHTSSSSGSLYALSLLNSGSITNTGANSSLFIGSNSFGYNTSNTGNITVNASGANVYLDGNVDNTGGTLTATNGQFIFRGNNTTAHLNGGTISIAAGAHVYLNGTIDNTSATLNPPTSGTYELYGGTILGGTIAPSALAFTAWGGYLNGAVLNDNLTLPASAYVRFQNNASFSGTTANLGASSGLYWQQAGTLSGKSLTLADGSYIYVAGGNSTLTLAPTTSATGAIQMYSDGSAGTAITIQGNVTHTSASTSGYLYALSLANSGTITNAAPNTALFVGSNSSGYNTVNTGNITVNANGATIYLDSVDNTGGTLNALNGQLVFRGTRTTAQLNAGTTNIATPGHALLNATIDNTASTFTAPVGGAYELYGGTINQGTIASGALTFTTSGGTLNGATLLGNYAFPTSAWAYWTGGTNLGANGSISFASNSGVYWKQVGALTAASLNFASNGYVYLYGANAALTLDANTTATGDVQIYSDGSSGTALTNQGMITHGSGTGYLYAQTFTNAGNITVTGGTMYLGTSATGATIANNAGATIRLNGGNLSLQQPAASPLVNNGVIDIQSGTFYTNNRLSNGTTGMISGAGVISGNIIISGGAIAPGNSGIGILSFNGGTMTVAGAATFAVDLGGTTSDELVFQSPSGIINIGSGLLALSLNLLSAPTANTTYNLISITSGGYGMSGSFAGLPNNGDTVTANFGGNPFTFSINYQSNVVSLNYTPVVVPEPETYVLFGAGLLLVGAVGRMRRRRE